MAIYRGSGGSGDATADTSNTSAVAIAAANDAQDSANAAAASAVTASNAATSTAGSVAAAATSATNAATSASTATTQAGIATTKASEASTSATNAATSATNAASSATSASDSASTATTKASEASTSATNAASSASAASSSASNASSSATTATTKASEAFASASSAATSAATATTQATNAASSATSASGSATTATTQASAASTSATNAASSASAASTSATSASTSATTATTQAGIATTQATNSATSAAASAAARDAALAALDSFDDRYLGTKSADPTLDNDGNALVSGALYFNTVSNSMKVYDGSLWLAAYASLSGALLSANNLSDVTSVSSSRTNLGLGTMATQDASSVAITGGTLNGTLGATTPSTAVVTSLTSSALTSGRVTFASTGGLLADSASLTYDGTTLTSTKFAGAFNGTLGATTPSTVSATTISASGTNAFISNTATGTTGKYIDIANTSGRSQFGVDNSSGTTFLLSGGVAYSTTITSVGANPVIIGVNQAKVATFDTSGNLGLGVTPSAWSSTGKSIQIGNGSTPMSLFAYNNGIVGLNNNAYFNSGDKYATTNYASRYYQYNGLHSWETAPSGTAGNAITFTQAMTLSAAGNLGIGTASPTTTVTIAASSNYPFIHWNNSSNSTIAFAGWHGGTGGDDDFRIGTSVAKVMTLRTNNTERMRIDASGNLLVGATSNSLGYGGSGSYGKFLLAGTTTAIPTTDSNNPAGNAYATMLGSGLANTTDWLNLRGPYSNATHGSGILLQDAFYDNGGYGGKYIRAYGRNLEFGRVTNGSIGVSNATLTQHMVLDDSGNLLVGTTSLASGERLSVVSAGGVEAAFFKSGNDTGASTILIRSAAAGTGPHYMMAFQKSTATTVGTITHNDTSTSYNTSSDYRLKNSIAPMTGALAKVALLKPCTYKWNVDGSDGEGFIAHELQEVVPDCVTGEKDATREEEYEISPAIPAVLDDEGVEVTPAVEAVMGIRTVPVYQGIDTSFLVATLTAAIQEQQAMIDELKAKVAALEAA